MKITIFIASVLFFLPSLSQALCVNGDHVNLRAKPDAKSKVTWIVGRNMPLMEVERKGAWMQVKDFEGERHWIHLRNVTSRVDCVVVRAKVANLRLGPGSQFAQTDLGYVKKYATFKKLGRDEEWLKVQDAFGQIHWAHETTVWEPRNYSRVTF